MAEAEQTMRSREYDRELDRLWESRLMIQRQTRESAMLAPGMVEVASGGVTTQTGYVTTGAGHGSLLCEPDVVMGNIDNLNRFNSPRWATRCRGRAKPFELGSSQGPIIGKMGNTVLQEGSNVNVGTYLGAPVGLAPEQCFADDVISVQTLRPDMVPREANGTKVANVTQNVVNGNNETLQQLSNESNLVSCNRTGVMSLQQHGIWSDYQLPMGVQGERQMPTTPPRFRDRMPSMMGHQAAVTATQPMMSQNLMQPPMQQPTQQLMQPQHTQQFVQPQFVQQQPAQQMVQQQVQGANYMEAAGYAMPLQAVNMNSNRWMGEPKYQQETMQGPTMGDRPWGPEVKQTEQQLGRARERTSPYERTGPRHRSTDRWSQDRAGCDRYHDRSGESDLFENHLHSCSLSPSAPGKVKSGIYDKPSSKVKTKMIWPQKQLKFAFISKGVDFTNLTFEHFVAGQVMTIKSCKSEFEKSNRLRLLERICYWKIKGASWEQLREFYAAFVSAIKAHEMRWDDPLHELESMMIDKPALNVALKFEKRTRNHIEKWFCKDYNSSRGCSLQSGHKVMIRGDEREATHMCAKCWDMVKQVKNHPRVAETCPYYNK